MRRSHPIPVLAENAAAQSLAKHPSPEELRQHLRLLQERWGDLRERLERQLLPAERLRELLRAAGSPTDPGEIGLDLDRVRRSYALARQIRSRYTIFDLAAETGCLEACVAELFAPGGFWAVGVR